MKGGGHGQANIEFLEANGLEYNIVKVYDNGKRWILKLMKIFCR